MAKEFEKLARRPWASSVASLPGDWDYLMWAGGNSWEKVWSVNDYEPDPVIAKSYGMGSLESFGDYLYWGTMQVPGTGENPSCPVYIDGEYATTIDPGGGDLADQFLEIIDDYVASNFPRRAS